MRTLRELSLRNLAMSHPNTVMTRGLTTSGKGLVVLILVLGTVSPLFAQHRLDVYAYERPGNPVLGSHSFAVLDGVYSLSWNPATVRVGVVLPTQGINLSFQETLRAAREMGATVYYVGSVNLDEGKYRRACSLLLGMETGKFPYRLLGGHNCITVLAAIRPSSFRSGTAHGVEASLRVLNHLRQP
jgi:hypothetical protein